MHEWKADGPTHQNTYTMPARHHGIISKIRRCCQHACRIMRHSTKSPRHVTFCSTTDLDSWVHVPARSSNRAIVFQSEHKGHSVASGSRAHVPARQPNQRTWDNAMAPGSGSRVHVPVRSSSQQTRTRDILYPGTRAQGPGCTYQHEHGEGRAS